MECSMSRRGRTGGSSTCPPPNPAFQARPLPRSDAAFRVHQSDLALTVPKDVALATGSRAVDRAQFDQAMDQKTRTAQVRLGAPLTQYLALPRLFMVQLGVPLRLHACHRGCAPLPRVLVV